MKNFWTRSSYGVAQIFWRHKCHTKRFASSYELASTEIPLGRWYCISMPDKEEKNNNTEIYLNAKCTLLHVLVWRTMNIEWVTVVVVVTVVQTVALFDKQCSMVLYCGIISLQDYLESLCHCLFHCASSINFYDRYRPENQSKNKTKKKNTKQNNTHDWREPFPLKNVWEQIPWLLFLWNSLMPINWKFNMENGYLYWEKCTTAMNISAAFSNIVCVLHSASRMSFAHKWVIEYS